MSWNIGFTLFYGEVETIYLVSPNLGGNCSSCTTAALWLREYLHKDVDTKSNVISKNVVFFSSSQF